MLITVEDALCGRGKCCIAVTAVPLTCFTRYLVGNINCRIDGRINSGLVYSAGLRSFVVVDRLSSDCASVPTVSSRTSAASSTSNGITGGKLLSVILAQIVGVFLGVSGLL